MGANSRNLVFASFDISLHLYIIATNIDVSYATTNTNVFCSKMSERKRDIFGMGKSADQNARTTGLNRMYFPDTLYCTFLHSICSYCRKISAKSKHMFLNSHTIWGRLRLHLSTQLFSGGGQMMCKEVQHPKMTSC